MAVSRTASRRGRTVQPVPDPAEAGSRPPTTPAAFDLLERSRQDLLTAWASAEAPERYVQAHLSALRAAAAVIAVRGRLAPARRRSTPRSAWELLPRVAPELGDWAGFFAATAVRRAAVEAGRRTAVDAAAADALVRDAEAFHRAVESLLGLPPVPLLPERTAAG